MQIRISRGGHEYVIPLLIVVVLVGQHGSSEGRRNSARKISTPVQFHAGETSFYAKDRPDHPDGAKITRNSHFAQTYKLGYKILLVCVAHGIPRPQFSWFKDGSEIAHKRNIHLYEKQIGSDTLKSKIEIDPATLGDQGIYTCLASNTHDYDMKNFKTEYYY